MAILYKANETDFNHLGLGPLNEALSILVTEERNGMFELEMKYPIKGSKFNELKLDRLIKADVGHNLKSQRFKIIRVTKPIDGVTTINAEHISYLTQDLPLKPVVGYGGTASQALNVWKNSTIDTNPFIVSSDITANGSGTWSINDVKNAREALGGVSGSILDTYGGEYRFDNYSVRLMAQRGVNSGALIAYGKNLVDLTQEESISETFTSIYPYATYEDLKGKEQLLILPEYFVDSEYVGNYARRRIMPVDFSDDKIKDVTTLRSRSISYMKSNRFGIPKVNIDIKYVDLAKTLDYKDLALLEEVNLCDNVFVYFEDLDINTSAKIIKTVWDDLLEQYDSIEVGEAKSSLSNSINATVDGKLETVVKQVNTIQSTANGLNVIYRGVEQPLTGNIGDLWYEPDGIYENMYQWDGSIWKLMLSTRDLDSVSEEVKKHTDEIATVAKSANDAVAKADQAIIDAGFAQVDSNAAIISASNALTTANIAQTNSGTALTASQTAIANSGTALTNAKTALNAYNNLEIGGRNLIISSTLAFKRYLDIENGDLIVALTHIATDFISVLGSTDYILSAKNLHQIRMVYYDENKQYISGFLYSGDQGTEKLITTPLNARFVRWSGDPINGSDLRTWKFERGTKATDWTPAPEDVQVQIADINGELSRKVAQTTFDTLNGTVTTQGTLISQSQTAIGLKADKTVVDTINSTVASHTLSIKATADSLATKAEKTLVDSINGTVAGHTSQIKVNADGLALKADSSLVNTVKGTVDTHTTQIKATSDGLALKAESSLVNTINGTVNTHTGQISANATAINARLTSAQVDTLVAGKNYVNETTLNATASSLSSQITQVETSKVGIIEEMTGGGKVFNNPASDSRGITTGALIINTPITSSYMTKLTISGYNYTETNSNIDLEVTFYAYTSPQFKNYSYVNKGDFPIDSVRIARDTSGRAVVIIGTGTSNWQYPKIQVTQAIIGYTNPPDSYKDGWNIEYLQSFPAYTAMTTLSGVDYNVKISTIEQTVDGIQTTVGTKASQTQVTQLATQITTKVESSIYNSKMTQLDSAINLRVQSGDITSAILADKTIKDTRSANQTPAWYFANYPKQTVEEFKQRVSVLAPGTAEYGQMTTIVPWNDNSGGSVIRRFSSSDGIFQSSGNATSWTAWDKVAESGKLISQINVSTEGILLQGKRIQLDGDVTMTTAFVGKIKAIDIAADRITTGTLNAANVNLINLNVSKIVGLNSNFIQSEWNKVNSSVSISGDGIKTVGSNGAQAMLQNGVFYAKNPSGIGLGTIGSALDSNGNIFAVDIVKDQSFGIRQQSDTNSTSFDNIIGYYDYLNRITLSRETHIVGELNMNGYEITAVKRMNLDFLNFNSVDTSIAPSGEYLDFGGYSGMRFYLNKYQAFVLSRNRSTGANSASLYASLNMQGYNITNQSDKRLKTNIRESAKDALTAMKKWNFVEYEWIDHEKPSGNQFGLIAQDTPELMTFEEQDDYYGIDSSVQIMLTSKGVQELAFEYDKNEIEIANLKEEIAKIKQKLL